jgi:hypothetical protein
MYLPIDEIKLRFDDETGQRRLTQDMAINHIIDHIKRLERDNLKLKRELKELKKKIDKN